MPPFPSVQRFAALFPLLLAGCVSRPATSDLAPSRLPFRADTIRTTVIAPGLIRHYVYSAEGPWAINLLEVHRDACWTARAVKGAVGAAGRTTTSALLARLAQRETVMAGVNADFFSLATGVPVSLHVEGGRVVSGPGPRPVVAFDSAGAPTIGTMTVAGSVVPAGHEMLRLSGWNHTAPAGLAVFDRDWGAMSDTASAVVEVGLAGPAPYRVQFVDTLPARSTLPEGGLLLIAGVSAPSAMRAELLGMRVGDTVRVSRALSPSHPREAVGGWPIILRGGTITGAVDSAGSTFAPVRHPRTAIGVADFGRTLLIAVVDGRQKGYSDGMTLRELARLFQSLGARDALNLDGGGSSTFVAADSDSLHTLRVRNKPSDSGGERTVGNALAIVRGCSTNK